MANNQNGSKKYVSLSTLQEFLNSLKSVFATKTEVDGKSKVQIVTTVESVETTEDVPTLKIHKMTKEEYDEALTQGNIDENALYLTPEEEIDLSLYATAEQLAAHDHDDEYYTKTEIDETFKSKVDVVDYNESIIGLSVEGTIITYIKADGSSHTIETQDTDTTYSLGTDEVTGLTKLYATVGNAVDGTMTQYAIKTELDKKVEVSVDSTQNTLVFTNGQDQLIF